MEDDYVRNLSPVDSLHLGNISPAPSYNYTPDPTLVLTLILVLFSTPVLASKSSDKLFRQFIKAYLEFHKSSRSLTEGK